MIWSAPGRSRETLTEFFQLLGEDGCHRLKGICCDMWRPYIDVVQQYAPQATIVFDKFHIVSHLMKAVDQVRRDEIREKGKSHKELVTHTRYIWLKNPWNLTDQQKGRLSVLEKLNLKINRAYLLKESFRQLWNYKTMGWAARFLKKWFWWATHSRLEPMRKFAWMVRRHQEDILSYLKVRIDNGSVEGLNNKAKVIAHRAFGYRTAETFKLALYHGLGQFSLCDLAIRDQHGFHQAAAVDVAPPVGRCRAASGDLFERPDLGEPGDDLVLSDDDDDMDDSGDTLELPSLSEISGAAASASGLNWNPCRAVSSRLSTASNCRRQRLADWFARVEQNGLSSGGRGLDDR